VRLQRFTESPEMRQILEEALDEILTIKQMQ
jgi:hypothetical protein